MARPGDARRADRPASRQFWLVSCQTWQVHAEGTRACPRRDPCRLCSSRNCPGGLPPAAAEGESESNAACEYASGGGSLRGGVAVLLCRFLCFRVNRITFLDFGLYKCTVPRLHNPLKPYPRFYAPSSRLCRLYIWCTMIHKLIIKPYVCTPGTALSESLIVLMVRKPLTQTPGATPKPLAQTPGATDEVRCPCTRVGVWCPRRRSIAAASHMPSAAADCSARSRVGCKLESGLVSTITV